MPPPYTNLYDRRMHYYWTLSQNRTGKWDSLYLYLHFYSIYNRAKYIEVG